MSAAVFISVQTQSVPLDVVSGMIAVESLGPQGLRASLAMELELPDHTRFSVTDGHVELSGCRVVTYPAGCITVSGN